MSDDEYPDMEAFHERMDRRINGLKAAHEEAMRIEFYDAALAATLEIAWLCGITDPEKTRLFIEELFPEAA